MRNRDNVPPALRDLIEARIIDEVLFELNPGKEATVYVVQKQTDDGPELYAAKVYRDVLHRAFRRDDVYREGRVILDERIATAVRKKTRLGRAVAFGMWVGEEVEMLRRAYEAGADVPAIVEASGSVILMDYIGDLDGPAPMLSDVRLEGDDVGRVFEATMGNVETLLAADIVHADLSAYNVLYWEGRPVIIDLPQAVDARLNHKARDLLARDIANVCRYFRRLGMNVDPEPMARGLWGKYEMAQL
jgi:RIO kinase 1